MMGGTILLTREDVELFDCNNTYHRYFVQFNDSGEPEKILYIESAEFIQAMRKRIKSNVHLTDPQKRKMAPKPFGSYPTPSSEVINLIAGL
jgi:hypothetical protein